jgi:hypothetical protein
MLNSEQQRVFNWLDNELQLPVFAEAYKGALLFLKDKPPGYITFVSHAGRDLMNILVSTAEGIWQQETSKEEGKQKGRVQYHDALDKLEKEWKSEWGAGGFKKSDDTENGHLIPYEICQNIKDLIEEHRKGRLRNTDADYLFFSKFLDYFEKEKVPENSLLDWRAAKKWFRKHAHVREGKFSEEDSSDVLKHFQTLHGFLHGAAISEYERIKSLNEILEEANG